MIRALSKYKIIERLGAGGMGEVYKAEDPALLRMVAIKVIPRHQYDEPGAELRFIREARAASAINHPNIVTIYEIGETDDQAFIVMEYVRGRTLRDLIVTRSIKPEIIINIALQICDALAEAHSHGIIHRDIKPENILLTERNQVKLLDFGLAKIVAGTEQRPEGETVAQSLTASGAVMGTLSYMSPEQLLNQTLDGRTDLFSLGIVLHELITGRLPFSGANSYDVAAAILKDQAAKIQRLPANIPQGITAIVARLLEKDREKRYSSAREVSRALEALNYVPPPLSDARETALFESVDRGRAGSAKTATAPRPQPEAPEQAQSPKPSAPTILVLPLETVGSGQENSFIGMGLAHAIRTDLAKISGLSVLSKSAGAGRMSEPEGVRELARELGATILLEGEVMRAGHVIGVMARLTDVETGHVIWGSQYRGDAADLFSIQDAVCESVAAALKVNISAEVRNQLLRPATFNINAFEFYSKGRAFLERRDVKTNLDYAVQMFDEALRLDQDFALAYAGLGEAYWHKYQDTHDNVWVEQAISASDRALVLDPYQSQVHVSLGIIYHGTGRLDRAIEELERAIKLQPMSDDAYKWLGRCYTNKGEMARAISYFERAIEIRTGYWDNYIQLGFCYYTFGDYHKAAEQFRRVITIQPDNYLGYNNLGGMYLLLGFYEEAVAMHLRAIEIHPHHRSYSNLGTAYFYLGQYEKAIAAYKAAIDLNPRDDIYNRNLGDAYLRVSRALDARKQFESASNLLKEPLAINPDDAVLLGRLAIYQAKLGHKEEALESIERATSLESHNTTIMYQRAVVHTLIGNADKAIEYLARALSHGYSSTEAERDPDLELLRDRADYKALFVSQGDKARNK